LRPSHPPTRSEALARLQGFLPHAGRDYAARRNYDLPGHGGVSVLSPYIRHRLITEDEVLTAVLGRFALSSAEKFVQEVFWRTYWKGWLEMRPSVWTDYRNEVRHGLDRIATEAGLRATWEAACSGTTGIDAFDHWARELVQTGYLHNHARMWFASIWCFTLRLPWALGADFFLRHLLDGDPASNTLGWRWVAGLQTPGKTYLARATNIAKYTEGRFRPDHQLAAYADPVDGMPNPPRGAAPEPAHWDAAKQTGLLLTEEDLSPGFLLTAGPTPAGTGVLLGDDARSPLHVSDGVTRFTEGAVADTAARYGDRLGIFAGPWRGEDAVAEAAAWATGFEQIVTPYPPVGPAADRIAALETALRPHGIPVIRALRPYDARAWPHATHGFFRFKDKIPKLAAALKPPKAA
jgi:deoxyribodipyrimidine photo-lyase